MPELPEVEIVRRKLKEAVQNRKIIRCSVFVERMIRTPDVETFLQTIQNQTIQDVKRLGKHLIFQLDDYELVSHLRMEGKYEYTSSDKPKNKHDHIIFHFNNGEELRYNDVRKFGTMDLVKHAKDVKSVAELGPEPLDESLKADYLKHAFSKKKTTIKQTLLDQSIVAGLGNIYVDEVLFLAGIYPKRMAHTLSIEECEKITKSIRKTIATAIELGGSSVRSYNSMGEAGSMQSLHKVYNKTGMPCNVCQTPIEKMKLGGRGTHFCPHCQN